MKRKLITASLASLLPLTSLVTTHAASKPTIQSIEFIGMNAPTTIPEMSKTYTTAKVKITYSDKKQQVKELSYKTLFETDREIGANIKAGTPINFWSKPIMDKSVTPTVPYISDAPDSNDLLQPIGLKKELHLITHYEYDTKDAAGNSTYKKVPASMTQTVLKQNKKTGELQVEKIKKVDFSSVDGLWVPCNGSQSPWNTHLGSEEYEPDARKYEEEAGTTMDSTLVKSFSKLYFGNELIANPYSYGYIPEVKIDEKGATSVVKHYSLGRLSYELVNVMPDKKTVYMGDDGAYGMMFMYVADQAGELSAGTLYGAKWIQTSNENGGSANLQWIKLGHATDEEVKALIDQRLKFSDIFETSKEAKEGFKLVKTMQGTEYLKLKPGMEKAAAFLESRRYGALLGATSEFNKMEGLATNGKDKKVYMALSTMEKGMEDSNGKDPVDDIKLPKRSSGAVFELSLEKDEKVNSEYVATSMKALVVGEDLATPDMYGNKANVNKVSNPDNLSYSSSMNTLFIGEDSGLHVNNFVWAYNIKTGKLSRLLSVPAGAESTGLQIAENRNGFTYLMSNFQHPGDELENVKATAYDVNELIKAIDTTYGVDQKGVVGYLQGIPTVK